MSMSLTGSRFSSESTPGPFHHGIRGRGRTILAAASANLERNIAWMASRRPSDISRWTVTTRVSNAAVMRRRLWSLACVGPASPAKYESKVFAAPNIAVPFPANWSYQNPVRDCRNQTGSWSISAHKASYLQNFNRRGTEVSQLWAGFRPTSRPRWSRLRMTRC